MSGLDGLRNYEQQKFAITDVLRAASALADKGNREWGESLRDLFSRLAEDRFNLVVVGRFSRGKTSLMNAIMATDRLPTGIVPITSVITPVAYGSKEKVVIEYREEGRLDRNISLEQLPQYITQEGNPGNVRGVKLAEVRLPAEILRSGFYFVDTPGLGSAIAENTQTTEDFLPEADALLLVTSYDSPVSSEEMAFIQAAHWSARPLFVVLNKHDTVSLDERESALAYARAQIRQLIEIPPPIFSVSARDGLEAKLHGNVYQLEASGIPALEAELVRFMVIRKETEFLVRTHDRATHLLGELPPSREKEKLQHRLHDLRGELGREVPASAVQPAILPGSGRELEPCELCAHVYKAQHRFLRQYQYDLVHSEDAQRLLAETNGFCSFHTRQFEAISSQAGVCMGYPALLERLASELRNAASLFEPPAAARIKLHTLLPAQDSCVLCGIRTRAEAKAITALAGRLSGDGVRVLDTLSAICLPHLAILSDALPDSNLIRALTERQATILDRSAEDMRRYGLKRDALRRYLISEEEAAAAERAINILVGHRQVGFIISSIPRIASERGAPS